MTEQNARQLTKGTILHNANLQRDCVVIQPAMPDYVLIQYSHSEKRVPNVKAMSEFEVK